MGYLLTPDTRQQKILIARRPKAIRQRHHRPRNSSLIGSGERLRPDAGQPLPKLWIVAVARESRLRLSPMRDLEAGPIRKSSSNGF